MVSWIPRWVNLFDFKTYPIDPRLDADGHGENVADDSQEFYRPIITPWELLLALRGASHEWEPNKWTLDFDRVIEGGLRLSTHAANPHPNR